MQDSSLSDPIINNKQATPASQATRPKGKRSPWQHVVATQRLYWRQTLTVFGLTVAICGGLALLLWQQLSQAVGVPWGIILLAPLGAALLLTAAMMAVLQASSHAVRRITGVVQRLAGGDHAARADLLTSGELNQLSRAVNRLAERHERQLLLRKRERDRFESVLQSTGDGVIILDRRGYVAQMNGAAERLLRLEADKAIHQSFVQVVRDYRLADVWQQCAQSGEEQVATIEVSAGFFLRIHVTPFRKSTASGFLVLLQDLSHLYRLEAVRRDFVSNISHELRTPLASIKALVDTLRDGALSDPPAAEHFLGRMEIEVDSMTQMVQELLELSRIESGQAPLRLFPEAVATLIEPAVERLRAQATRADLTLTVVLPDELPQVMVDADRIRQVVINLVHNAIKFTPPGGFITVTARAVREGVVVSVADTGIGIPAEDVARIFERFYKADRARSGGGTGLGLAIAKHTIQAHNGRLWVESAEGKGSTFSFTLPLANLPLTQL